MKINKLHYGVLLLFTSSAFASSSVFLPLDGIIFAQTKFENTKSCQEIGVVTPEMINMDTESFAFQQCGDLGVEEVSSQVNAVSACLQGLGGSTIYQKLYRCGDGANPDAVFSGGSRILSGKSEKRHFGLIYDTDPCVEFELVGSTSQDTYVKSLLIRLADNLQVVEGSSPPQTLDAEVIAYGGKMAIQYKRKAINGFRGSGLSVQTNNGKSVDDTIASDLGTSPVTNYKFGIRVLTSECK